MNFQNAVNRRLSGTHRLIGRKSANQTGARIGLLALSEDSATHRLISDLSKEITVTDEPGQHEMAPKVNHPIGRNRVPDVLPSIEPRPRGSGYP